MTIRKKSKEELQAQAEWFLDYASERWKITEKQKKKISKTLWISELDEKWFFERLSKKFWKEIDISDELEIKKVLKKKKINVEKLWDEYLKYLHDKSVDKHNSEIRKKVEEFFEPYKTPNDWVNKKIIITIANNYSKDMIKKFNIFLTSEFYKDIFIEWKNIHWSLTWMNDKINREIEYVLRFFVIDRDEEDLWNLLWMQSFDLLEYRVNDSFNSINFDLLKKNISILNKYWYDKGKYKPDVLWYCDFEPYIQILENQDIEWFRRDFDQKEENEELKNIFLKFEDLGKDDLLKYCIKCWLGEIDKVLSKRPDIHYENNGWYTSKLVHMFWWDWNNDKRMREYLWWWNFDFLAYLWTIYWTKNWKKNIDLAYGKNLIKDRKIVSENLDNWVIARLKMIDNEILDSLIKKWVNKEDFEEFLHIIDNINYKNLEILLKKYPSITVKELNKLEDENTHILSKAKSENLKLIFEKYSEIKVEELNKLENENTHILSIANPENLKIMFENFSLFELWDFENNEKLLSFTGEFPDDLQFKENNHKWYLKYIVEVIDLNILDSDKQGLISHIVKLPFWDIDNYLQQVVKFLSRWFDIQRLEGTENLKILNDSINTLYPWLNVEFNEEETEEVLWFVDSIWWINKWYSILILTIEKLQRDWISGLDLKYKLIEKLREYKKVLDMYPEDKIPDWLKISVGLEFEMTRYFLKRYKQTTWNDYNVVVNKVVNNAKVWIEREWVYEFATKPSTNPMAALLEIHLLQELNLLDINDMQKLLELRDEKEEEEEKKDLVVWKADYNSRNWTGYHLNIWSDADIWVDENIQFIQNFCTILPRWWMNNWENVRKVNGYSNVNSKSSKFSVFPNSESRKYIELRTYSVDDVELFEKNVLLNTYAVMWSQAQKKVSTVTSKTVMDLRENDTIKNAEDLMKYLLDNKLFLDNQDYKSKRIAAEFIFMQIAALRAIHDYNIHFFDNELFGINEISEHLNESWKNYFMDLLCLDNGESIWYNDNGQSSRFVKFKCKKLYAAFHDGYFNFDSYLEKDEPFSEHETVKILDQYGESVDEEKISLVTTRLNKRLLWEKLMVWCEDTQSLEKSIAEKKMNIDRIRSNIRWMDQTLKVDKEYLKEYFKTHMSLIQDNPYHWMNIDFMNKIINLNNFFLKKDDTNANWVLQKTIFEWEEEPDISKSSIFETWWYMRKWYNYYQWWTENMLLHSAQKIAMNYMGNVRNILNTDYDSVRNINLTLDQAA